jgi:hypothetical protein
MSSKYRSVRTRCEGIIFDSKLEAERWAELRMLENAGRITNLKRQVRFHLLDKLVHEGETHRKKAYVADFTYEDPDHDRPVVEDVKGVATPMYRMKKHMFLLKYGKDYVFIETRKTK